MKRYINYSGSCKQTYSLQPVHMKYSSNKTKYGQQAGTYNLVLN
jgi:hypothetical protein